MRTITSLRRSLHGASILLSCVVLSAALAHRADATVWTLLDENSSVDIDTGAQAGVYNWFVDGVDQLNQQWFWYRVGSSGGEASVDTLPIIVQGVSDGNFDGNDDTLFVNYGNASFNIAVTYLLDGALPGSGASDLSEQISITNLTNQPLDFHFFQYSDFNLSAGQDTGVFTNANTVRQSSPGALLSETVVTPSPSHRELAFFPAILNSLNNGTATTLADTPGQGVPLGPGDVTWGYQWDVSIPAFGTFQISKDKNLQVVPEPASWAMMAIGAALLGVRCVRRKKR